MAGEIQLNSTTMATESSGSITAELDTIRPNTTNGSLTLQGDSSDAGVTGLTIDSSGVVNTTTAKVTNIQATAGQSLTIKDEDGNAAITIGTDTTAAGYLSLNFGSYHGDSGGAGSGTLSGNILSDYEFGTWTPVPQNNDGSVLSNNNSVGWYRKVGKLVWVQGWVRFSAAPGGSANDCRIAGFPFANITTDSGPTIALRIYGTRPLSLPESGQYWGLLYSGTNQFFKFYYDNSGTLTTVQGSDLGSDSSIQFSFTYSNG